MGDCNMTTHRKYPEGHMNTVQLGELLGISSCEAVHRVRHLAKLIPDSKLILESERLVFNPSIVKLISDIYAPYYGWKSYAEIFSARTGVSRKYREKRVEETVKKLGLDKKMVQVEGIKLVPPEYETILRDAMAIRKYTRTPVPEELQPVSSPTNQDLSITALLAAFGYTQCNPSKVSTIHSHIHRL